MNMEMAIDDPALIEITNRLIAAVDPGKIVLFGSRAKGTSSSESDYDILIIKPSDDLSIARALPAYRALDGMPISKDILWKTPEEVEEWRDVASHVVTRAMREGRVLYEKGS